jgi:hypothetical protein
MVVYDFNVKRTIFTFRPLKTKSPLPVNANTELTPFFCSLMVARPLKHLPVLENAFDITLPSTGEGRQH